MPPKKKTVAANCKEAGEEASKEAGEETPGAY